MVRRQKFLKGEEGAVLVEGLLVLPILVLVMAAFVEFGFAMFQWNQTVKAVQIGARQLAVSDPILADMAAFDEDLTDLDAGVAVPAAIVTVSCGAGTTACDPTGMGRLISGSDGACDADLAGSVSGMCDFFPLLSEENVRVTYQRAGLGYVGRPSGPVLSITVETFDMSFDFLILDALLGGNAIAMPRHSVTITSEDLSTSGPSS
jgi:TadE-like protein